MNLNDKKYHNSTPMGIHRLMAEPYDDREIFTTVSDLIDYCEKGACYDGQRVVCINGYNTNNYIPAVQEFTIKKYLSDITNNIYKFKPIIKLDNIELVWKYLDGNNYLQIYYYNAFINNKKYITRKSTPSYPLRNSVFLKDPSAFSIYEFVEIFADKDSSNKLTYNLNFKTESDTTINMESITTYIDPITVTSGGILLYPSELSSSYSILYEEGSNKYIKDFYVKANEYYKAINR